MPFSDLAAALDTAVFDHLGDAASWRAQGAFPGVDVRVIQRAPDEVVEFGRSRAVVATCVLEVSRAAVIAPRAGDIVETGGRLLKVIGEPTLSDDRAFWTCEAKEVQP